MLAGVAQEVHAAGAAEPVGVVAQPGARWPPRSRGSAPADAPIRAALASICSRSSIGRSARLPLGSPTIPVPPPTSGDRRCPFPLQPGQAHDRHQVARHGASRRSGRSPRSRSIGPWREPFRQAGRRVLNEAAGGRSVRRSDMAGTNGVPVPGWKSRTRQPASRSMAPRAFGPLFRTPLLLFVRMRLRWCTSRDPLAHPPRPRRDGRLRRRHRHRGVDPRLPGDACPSIGEPRRALRSPAGIQGLRRRRPAHHRLGLERRTVMPARRDGAVRSGRPSWSPRTSASTSTTASISGGCSARSRPTCWRSGSPRGSPPSPCSWPATSGPRTSAAATGRSRRKLREAQVALEIERQLLQGPDPRAVPQSDRPGQRRVRGRGGLPAVLRQVGPRPQRRRSRDAGGPAQGAHPLQPAAIPRPGGGRGATWC